MITVLYAVLFPVFSTISISKSLVKITCVCTTLITSNINSMALKQQTVQYGVPLS